MAAAASAMHVAGHAVVDHVGANSGVSLTNILSAASMRGLRASGTRFMPLAFSLEVQVAMDQRFECCPWLRAMP